MILMAGLPGLSSSYTAVIIDLFTLNLVIGLLDIRA